MLDTRNVDPDKAAGTEEEYRNSRTVATITDELVRRYRAGGQKYGVFIDEAVPPTNITGETSFAEMAYNEALDGVTYSLKAKEELQDLQNRFNKLSELYTLLEHASGETLDLNKDLVNRVAQLEGELEMARFEADQAHREGNLSKEQEAALVHRNVELEKEVAKLTKHVAEYRRRYANAAKTAKMFQTRYKTDHEALAKVPGLLRGLFNA